MPLNAADMSGTKRHKAGRLSDKSMAGVVTRRATNTYLGVVSDQ